MSSPEIMSFTRAAHNRRSIRSLQATSPVPDTTITALAEKAILDVPSAFNSQTTRMTILFGTNHQKLWSIVARTFHTKLGDERFSFPSAGRPAFRDKIASYMDAYGTLLFWDDVTGVKELKETSPDVYKDKIDEWAHQSNGMHQYYMWTALELLGLGVNLQHYNPLIDDEVKRMWGVPEFWTLKAQMVFGTPIEGIEVGEKVQKLPLTERLKVFGAGSE
jgi:predicted oxidoreductase (fatty acid repression mutant protein)